MHNFLDEFLSGLFNHRSRNRATPVRQAGLDIGQRVVDREPVSGRVAIAQNRRAEGLMLLGKTGTGKSYLIRHLAQQDINASRGFIFFDLHGDVIPFLLKCIAARERVLRRDLSDRLIVVDLADPENSVGWNLLETEGTTDRFMQVAAFSKILKDRWHLDGFGPRTDEALRNSLYVLSESGLTLVELAPLLTDAEFRSRCLARVTNNEVREYFEVRYNQLSDAMQRVTAEPVLNKVSLFLADPKFRHLLGQQSTFSLVRALDTNCWILLNLDKGRLGEHSATVGSIFLTKTAHKFFLRSTRSLFSVYGDEVQNLVAYSGGTRDDGRRGPQAGRGARHREPVPRAKSGRCPSGAPRDGIVRILPAFRRGRSADCRNARRREIPRRAAEKSAAPPPHRENCSRALVRDHRADRAGAGD